MSNKKIARAFVDDTTGRILDNTYRMLKDQKAKKDAEKLLKYIIKTVVKVGILHKNDQFNALELKLAVEFKKKFHDLTITVISFWEVDFTYDQQYVSCCVNGCRQLLQKVIARHLSDKTKCRIDAVFFALSDSAFLNAVYTKSGNTKKYMDIIVQDLHKLIDEGNL